MEKSAADVVMVFTGMEMKNKTNEKGRIDMRFAVDEIREEARAEGIQGLVRAMRKLHHSEQQILEMVMAEFNLTAAEAEVYMEQSNEKGKADARFAVDEIREEARAESIQDMIRALREFHYSEQQILELVMAAFHLTAAEAEAYLDEPEETEEN